MLQRAEVDLKSVIAECWSEHEKTVNDLLRDYLAKRRYLCRISRHADKQLAVTKRTLEILQQISLQLCSKTSVSKFTETKQTLKKTIVEVEGLKTDSDWVLVPN